MKQPELAKLRIALASKDALDIVNAFMVRPPEVEEIMPEYWEHRLCALAEMIVDKAAEDSWKLNQENYRGRRW